MRAVEITGFYKSMSDPQRIRILSLLSGGEPCICHLSEILEMDQVRLSKQLRCMKDQGAVKATRSAQWMIYRVAEPVKGLLAESLRALRGTGDLPFSPDRTRSKKLMARVSADCSGCPAESVSAALFPDFLSRLRHGWNEAVTVIRQIWVWVLVGVAAGSLIHNFVPGRGIHNALSATGIFSVPLATLLGVPMYGSCAAIVPVAVVLFEKGIPLGTALAFMMAMAALALPEAIMLRRTMRLKLIAFFSPSRPPPSLRPDICSTPSRLSPGAGRQSMSRVIT